MGGGNTDRRPSFTGGPTLASSAEAIERSEEPLCSQETKSLSLLLALSGVPTTDRGKYPKTRTLKHSGILLKTALACSTLTAPGEGGQTQGAQAPLHRALTAPVEEARHGGFSASVQPLPLLPPVRRPDCPGRRALFDRGPPCPR